MPNTSSTSSFGRASILDYQESRYHEVSPCKVEEHLGPLEGYKKGWRLKIDDCTDDPGTALVESESSPVEV